LRFDSSAFLSLAQCFIFPFSVEYVPLIFVDEVQEAVAAERTGWRLPARATTVPLPA
jgi:hypothetical protein